MNLRRKTLYSCKGDPRLQKALAIALYLKHLLGRTSTMPNWSANKLHKLSGISPTTLKKYLPIIRRQGWAHFCGKNNEHLVISSLSSHTADRNIRVDAFRFDSFKETYRSLRAFLALAIQHRKDFIGRTIQTYRDPSSHKELVKARKTLKRLVGKGILKGVDVKFRELGTSYKRIAQETGNCIKTAQNIIRYALNMGWCHKKRNCEQYYLKGICFREGGEFFTFSTRSNIYIMHPNRYILHTDIETSLGGGILDGKK